MDAAESVSGAEGVYFMTVDVSQNQHFAVSFSTPYLSRI